MKQVTKYQNVDSFDPNQQQSSLAGEDRFQQPYQQQQPNFQKMFKYLKYSKIFLALVCVFLSVLIYIQKSKDLPMPVNIRQTLPEAFRIFDQNLFYIQTTPKQNNQKMLKQKTNVTGLTLVYVTQQNMQNFAIQKYPFNKMYIHLSPRHKQQYLKAFFNHFYGGGYVQSDIAINAQLKNWQKGRTKFRRSMIWMMGRQIQQQKQVPIFEDTQLNRKIHSQGGWKTLIKANYFITKPSNKLTQQIYKTIEKMIDQNKQNLANGKYPFDQKAFEKVFYAACLKYNTRLDYQLQIQNKQEGNKYETL